MSRRVVITGMGTVNCLGHDVETYWKNLCAGKSGIGLIDLFDVSQHKVKFGGQVRDFDPDKALDPRTARRLDRFAQFGLVGAIDAVKDSGLDFAKEDLTRSGVIIGSGIGGLSEYEEQHTRLMKLGPSRIRPFVIPKLMVNAASGPLSIHFCPPGPHTAGATALPSAAHAHGALTRGTPHHTTPH